MPDQIIPRGYCHCGCGGKTNLADRSISRKGQIKGEPLLWIQNHFRHTARSWTEEDRGYETPCWIWDNPGTIPGGYGVATVKSRITPAHRWVYEQRVGPIPAGLQLDHLCRVPRCVNPDHLEPVTQEENIRRGLAAKLTKEQVRAIRAQRAAGRPRYSLAAEYQVNLSTISDLCSRRSWANFE